MTQCVNRMFKVSALLAVTVYTDAVADCSVNDTLIKAAPFTNQLFFQSARRHVR